MSVKKQLQECWKYVMKMTRNKNSFDIGFLHHTCNILLNEQILSTEYSQTQKPYFQSSIDFVNSVIDFLQQAFQKSQRKGQQSSPQNQFLALIVLDSIIFNLYARSKNMDKVRLNNSFFNNSVSMSMSQMSDQWSEHNSVVNNNNDQLRLALTYVQALATNVNFFKKLKVLYERPNNKTKNHHYMENLLQTLEYVLNKEKLTTAKQTFSSHRMSNFKTPIYTQSQPFSPTPELLELINSAIFTNQLNKLTTLLSTSSEQPLFSLNRIYFMNRKSSDRKHFRNLKYNSTDMVFNLCRVYVESFKSKMEVFEESRNPLFLWMKNYLQCFYLPIWRRWVGLVSEVMGKESGGMLAFYKGNQQVLERGVLMFIEQLPTELVEFLNMLYRLIDKHFANLSPSQKLISPVVSQQSIQPQSISSLIPVKRFFIYSFLADPQLIKEHIFTPQSQAKSPLQIQKFEETCNYMINLFFSSSVKKYSTTYTPQQLSVLMNLSMAIQQRLDQKLTQCDPAELYYEINDDTQTQLSNYFIEEPILNYDYEILHKRILEIEFTPKDLKQFEMKRDSVYGGSKQVLLHKDVDQDFIIGNNNEQPRNNMRYMRKDTDIFVNNEAQNNRRFTHKRENSESPSKMQDREDIYQRLHKEARSNTFNAYNYNAATENYYSNEVADGGQEGQVDFLTWMTVGGNHNYKEKISARKIKLAKTMNLGDIGLTQQNSEYLPDKTNTFGNKKFGNTLIMEADSLYMTRKSQLKEFKTFNKDKVKEINRLYQEYQSKNLFA